MRARICDSISGTRAGGLWPHAGEGLVLRRLADTRQVTLVRFLSRLSPSGRGDGRGAVKATAEEGMLAARSRAAFTRQITCSESPK